MSRCRSCSAEITWAVTAKGRRIPLDAVPTSNGTLLLRNGKAESAVGAEPDEPRYTAHFATCPNAAQHRKTA